MSAAELVGVLVTGSDPNHSLAECGSLLTLAPCAVVVADSPDPWPMMEFDYYGVGVVRVGEYSAEVAIPPEDRSGEFRPSLFGRWMREFLYGRALEVGARTAGAAP